MTDIAYILKNSVQSSKSVDQIKNNNVYTFKVERSANKFQIKVSLETIFGVKVDKVRISRKKPFSKNRRTITSLEKKAFVKLKQGYKIDDFGRISEIFKNVDLNEGRNSLENLDNKDVIEVESDVVDDSNNNLTTDETSKEIT